MDTYLRWLADQAARRSLRKGDSPHYRCVICWARNPWGEGCADKLDRLFSSLVDQRIYVDKGRYRWPASPVTDAGLCSTCCDAIEPIDLVAADAEAL